MTDRLLIRLYPLFSFFAVIGMLCGVILIGLGAARYLGRIDMGPSFAGIEPIWMMAGGAGLALTFWLKRRKIRAGVLAAKTRAS